MPKTWRDHMRPLVDIAIESGRKEGLEGNTLLRYAQRSYPWGNKVGFHGKKIWNSECRVQLKIKTPHEIKKAESKGRPLFGDQEDG